MGSIINPYRFVSSFDPASLFEGGTYKGFYLDFNDTSTLKQNTGGTTAVTADGDPVGYVANKAPLGGTFLRGTDDTKRPLYKLDGGKGCLLFDGVDDFIEGDATVKTTTAGSQQFWTIVTVAQVVGGAAGGTMVWMYGANYHSAQSVFPNTTQYQVIAYNTPLNTNVTQTDKALYTAIANSDGASPSLIARRNGSQINIDANTTTSTLGSGNAQNINVGSFAGRIYQVFVINRILTGATLTDLEKELASRAGVTF